MSARPRPGSRRLPLLAGALATALVACSILNGLDADYMLQSNDTEKDGGEAGVADGATASDARDSSLVDAGFDAAGPFCAEHGADPHVVFCWDFEDSLGTPTKGFDGNEATEGSFSVEEGTGANGSRGLRVLVNIKKPAQSARVYVRKQIDTPFDDVSESELSFDFALKTQSTLYTAALGTLGWGAAASPKVIGLSVYANSGANAVDIGDPPATIGGDFVHPAIGEWQHATIIMKRQTDAGLYSSTMWVSGLVDAGATMVDPARPFEGGAGPTQILIGAFFTSMEADGGVEVVLDDVLLKQTP